MFAELIQKIVDLAHKGQDTQIKELDNGRMLVFDREGGFKEVSPKRKLPDPIVSIAGTIVDLVRLSAAVLPIVVAQKDERFEKFESVDAKPIIKVSGSRVLCILDPNTEEDSVQFNLTECEQFSELKALNITLDQKQLVRFLRVNLHGTQAENYASKFKQIVWNRSGEAKGRVGNSDESMGKMIESRVATSTEEDLPEVLKLSVPVFQAQELAYRASMEVIVTIDFDAHTFNLAIAPNQAKLAIDAAVNEVVAILEEATNDYEFEATVVRD